MTGFVIAPPAQPSVAVAGEDKRFPVRRIFCVGRNYAKHAREMGRDPDREPPFFFTKPADAVVDSGTEVPYPPQTANLHYEIELVIAIAEGGRDISPGDAERHVFGYGVGIDLTRRDLQLAAREAGRPWDWGKAFDRSAPCGPLKRARTGEVPESGRIWLAVNGALRQDADLAEMIWPVRDVVAICSNAVELKPGDLIYTGTPEGVGPVIAGDRITGGIDLLGEIAISIGAAG